ncbi:MAG TPA: DUF5723 family protein [Longimicrobiaceae bacterium]
MNGIKILLAASAAALAAAPAAAQVPLTPRALGMGGAYVASARGHEALFLNPANLGLAGTPRWSIALPQLGVGTTLEGPAWADLPDMANYDDITDVRKQELLDAIPQGGMELRVDSRLPVFALQTGRFAVGVSYGMVGEHSLGRDLVDLVFNGYEDGRTDYSVGRTQGSRATYLDFAAGYGRRVGPLSLGVTGHYLRGRTLMRSRMFEPRVDVAAEEISVEYVGVLANGGSGYAVDLGAALQPVRGVTLSASVANAFGRMKWSDDLRVRSITLHRADLEGMENDPFWIRDEYELSDRALDPGAATSQEYETARELYSEAYFPTTLRLGAAWAPARGTELGAAYQGNLTEGRLSGWWDRTASVGVQQKLPLVTVRAGYATNLEEGRMLTGGLSLGPIQLGAARVEDGPSRAGYVMTFGVSTRTPDVLN